MTIECPPGRLIVGFDGLDLTPETRERLLHPAVGGVILFSRNYASPDQLRALTFAIKAVREPRLLITVDQEGGRVQRFKAGFTPLPPLAVLGRWHRTRPDRAGDLAYRHGRIMAAEVLGHGVDLSWAPVLDLDRGSRVIGDRAMADDPEAVAELAAFYVAGMRDAGMAACAKHFPGHGSVAADTHSEVVTDPRPLAALDDDLGPFRALVNQLQAVMMAHVCYPACDINRLASRAPGSRSVSATKWVLAGWSFPTISTWPAPARRALSASDWPGPWPLAAISRWSAIRPPLRGAAGREPGAPGDRARPPGHALWSAAGKP